MEEETKHDLIKIIISAILLGIAIFIEHKLGLPMWANLLVFLVPYLLVGFETIKEAIENIFHGEIFDEDFLMFVATVGALAIGFIPGGEPQFAEAVFVMLFFQLGELFEGIAEGKSEKSIEALMEIRPDIAYIEKNGKVEKVDPNTVEVGEIMVIAPGQKVPMDGVVIEGKTTLNTVAITGESVPRSIDEEDVILSGCVNINGTVRARVTKRFEDSTVAKIIDLVENASEHKSKSEKFITKFSKVYTPIVVILAILVAIVPPILSGDFLGNFSTWLLRALTFLVVSCPCALVISVPLAFFGGIGGASKKGILIKGSNHVDSLSKISTVVFDKTGTLTEGVFKVVAIHPEIYDENKLLHLAAHVERYSSHPIAISLKDAYENEDDDCSVTEVEEFAGQGVKAKVNEDTVYVGNHKLMKSIGIDWKDCEKSGTIVHVAINGEYFGHIVISDRIKDDSKNAVDRIKNNSIKTVMLTGDHKDVAESVAKELGIDEFFAELLPQDKVSKLEEIINKKNEKSKNNNVAFVGDGINDAPVIARADVGIAMGAIGSDAAIESADVILMEDKTSKIADAIKIAKRTIKIAMENIVFAIAVKIIVLILAVFGYAPMWLAVFADVGVTVLAVLNSMRTLK
ncbi:MAG: cadmium-translocating P-type ATPase [Clostridia bacterium]|nr:cadmium-translocating P-type ATPase [Clostridia bacterium]